MDLNEPVAYMYQRIEADQYGLSSIHYSSTKWGDNESVHLYTETPLYLHPVKELHLSLQKTEDGELVAVTYTDDEHRIVEVLWERPPAKELTDEEIEEVTNTIEWRESDWLWELDFARAILRKVQEADKIESLGTVNIGGVNFRNGKAEK